MGIIKDSQFIEKETKGSLILSNNLENLDVLLKKFIKDKITNKFILIVNGSSAEKTFEFIKNKNYKSLFINGIIYTSNLEKYKKIKEKHPDFFKIICVAPQDIVKFIKKTFEKIKDYNENYYINAIINLTTYKDVFHSLHEVLTVYYGDDCDGFENYAFQDNYYMFSLFLEKEEIPDDIKEAIFSSCCKRSINYENIIISYLKNDNASKLLNLLLMKKDYTTNRIIGYFVSNFIQSLVEYGKKTKIGVNSNMTFYRGMQLDIVDLLEYLKNRGLIITFPYFISLTIKKILLRLIKIKKIKNFIL